MTWRELLWPQEERLKVLVSLLSGLALAAIAIGIGLPAAPERSMGSVTLLAKSIALGVTEGPELHITVTYPRSIRTGESGIVAVTILLSDVSDDDTRRQATLVLYGAGFALDPSGVVNGSVDEDVERTWMWTIAAKENSVGNQQLVLWISELPIDDIAAQALNTDNPQCDCELTLTVNGLPLKWAPKTFAPLSLPVRVLTRFGVAQEWVWIAQALLSFASFLLLYPLVVKTIGRRLQSRQKYQDPDY
jgi:hypothetical protein